MAEFRPILAQHDLTEQQWRVLRALAAHDRRLEVGELADATLLLGPSLSRMLVGMERRRLVSRSIVRHDARRSAVAITKKGARMVERIAPLSEARYVRIESALGGDRLALLEELLDEVAAIAAGSVTVTQSPSE